VRNDAGDAYACAIGDVGKVGGRQDIAKRGDAPIKTVEVGDRIAGSLQA